MSTVSSTEATVALPGGGRLVVRPVEHADIDLLAELFRSLSSEDRYRRFFSGFQPTGRFLQKMADANEHDATALVAVVESADGAHRAVGEASAWRLSNGNGELGLTVASEWRGWLGPYLLDVIIDAAAIAGMPNLEADVLVDNPRMLALLRARGCAVIGHDGYHAVRLTVSTGGVAPTWPRVDGRLRVLIESPSARWETLALGLPEGAHVIGCAGPARRPPMRPCPALLGEPCPLAEGADAIVINGITGQHCGALLQAHATAHPAVPVYLRAFGHRADDEEER